MHAQEAPGLKTRMYLTNEDSYRALISGEIDVVIDDMTGAQYSINTKQEFSGRVTMQVRCRVNVIGVNTRAVRCRVNVLGVNIRAVRRRVYMLDVNTKAIRCLVNVFDVNFRPWHKKAEMLYRIIYQCARHVSK